MNNSNTLEGKIPARGSYTGLLLHLLGGLKQEDPKFKGFLG